MANYNKIIRSIIIESIEEDSEYQRFFKATLNRFGAESPDDLDDETKKKFFSFIDDNWDAVDEARKKRNKKESINTVVNERSLKRGSDIAILVDTLVNAMEHFEHVNDFVQHISSQTKYKPNQLKKIFNDFWKVGGRDRLNWDTEEWVEWLGQFGINESVNETKRAYIKFLNKDKNFKEDIKYFTGKNHFEADKKATKWAKKNLEKFHPDMIHYESVNESFRPGTASAYNSKIQKWGKRYGVDVEWRFKGKQQSYFVFDMTFDEYSEALPREARDRLHALNKAYGVDFAYRNRNWTPIVETTKLVSESSHPHSGKIEALNDFFNGKISAEELKSMADDVFGRPVATKKQLQDFVNNKFLQGVMADAYDISTSQLVKKVKELLNKKVYEGIVTENRLPIQLSRVKDDFVSHIRKYGKVGSKGVSLTDKLDIVLYSPRPHHKRANQFEHGDPALFIVIEDSRNKRLVETDIVEFGSFDKSDIENGVDKALQQLTKLVKKSNVNMSETVNESEVPIEKVKVGDTVTNPTGGNKRTNPPVFTVDKIEKRKGSRGQEIVLHGKDRFGKKQALIRDKGKPVELRESIELDEERSPLSKRVFNRNKWGKAIHDKVLGGGNWNTQKVKKFFDDLEEKDPKKWEAAIRSLSHDALLDARRYRTYGDHIYALIDKLEELYEIEYIGI